MSNLLLKKYENQSEYLIQLFQTLIPDSTLKSSAVDKVVYRLKNNISCDAYYLEFILGLKGQTLCKYLALLELLQYKEHFLTAQESIASPKDFIEALQKYCRHSPQESFFLGLLNCKNKLIEVTQLFEGQTESVAIDLKRMFKHILCQGASHIIIAHNHPSGDPMPSVFDQQLTYKIRALCSGFGLGLLDHIIIGRKSYYSFKNRCLMPML